MSPRAPSVVESTAGRSALTGDRRCKELDLPRCSITVFVKTLRCRSVDQLVEERAVIRALVSVRERREAPRVRLLLSMRRDN